MSHSPKFDQLFKEINHFYRYPEMLPFVGKHYESAGHKKILVLGESNYLPKGSTVSLDAEKWYGGSSCKLNINEKKHISNIGLVNSGKNQKWKKGGHYMYKNIESCLIASGIKKEINSMSHIAYINGFFRPAIDGCSIKKIHKELDTKKSIEVINKVISIVKPDIVLIASIFTDSQVKKHLEHNNIEYTCHPLAHFYWQRKGYKNGKLKFEKIISRQVTSDS